MVWHGGRELLSQITRAIGERQDPPSLFTAGHVVTTAPTGQGGIDAFRAARAGSEAFAVVSTELGLPHVDGREVARAVKEVSPATPVMLLTGWGQ